MVEKGGKYKIEANFIEQNKYGFRANFNLDIAKKEPVNCDRIIKELKGVAIVIFAGSISPLLEGEQMSVDFPGFNNGDRTSIELPILKVTDRGTPRLTRYARVIVTVEP